MGTPDLLSLARAACERPDEPDRVRVLADAVSEAGAGAVREMLLWVFSRLPDAQTLDDAKRGRHFREMATKVTEQIQRRVADPPPRLSDDITPLSHWSQWSYEE
jgi:hypothetical protein